MRLDQRLTALGLAESRSRAQALIKAGVVMVDGVVERKPGRAVEARAQIALTDQPIPWVSRGGVKLAHAIEHFGVVFKGAAVLDIGASTGGFTEVCLAKGARRVYALDVGRDQLHPRLSKDPRVVDLSGVHAKMIDPRLVPEPIDWFVADVSFISLIKALPAPLTLAAPTARLIALVKPQFEVGPENVGRGGLVKDPAARADAVSTVRTFLETAAWRVEGVTDSPITGADGNQEFLLSARKT